MQYLQIKKNTSQQIALLLCLKLPKMIIIVYTCDNGLKNKKSLK